MLNKIAAKHIRAAVKAGGYEYWSTYNDKGAKTRRIKCMINGYNYGTKRYKMWDERIKAELDRLGVSYISAGFETCWAGAGEWRGSYIAYCVTIRLDGEPVTKGEVEQAMRRLEQAEQVFAKAIEAFTEIFDGAEDQLGDLIQAVSDTLQEVGEEVDAAFDDLAD